MKINNMKKIILFFALIIAAIAVQAQTVNPVKWSYAAKKVSDKVYQLVITATLPSPWHIYSQYTPDGGPKPTKIVYTKNPLLVINGVPKENGSLKTVHDDNFGVDVKYFGEKVEFVQTVQLKTAAKTSVTGTINYMVCNDKECLPPTKQPFEIKLQ
ncbi:hypothetical protein FC093_09580 [Ilyomonas limi]|uniref:Thiol:disulfide interchange protein DsbD N-terminal domain-containing protein n=2 Tax=Ilyomonas limi TaxID=2575867 RepID=A0A4U3L1R2_9BACT|nr:hypothetical protein FC093_09580 [Ilyomonas limi]